MWPALSCYQLRESCLEFCGIATDTHSKIVILIVLGEYPPPPTPLHTQNFDIGHQQNKTIFNLRLKLFTVDIGNLLLVVDVESAGGTLLTTVILPFSVISRCDHMFIILKFLIFFIQIINYHTTIIGVKVNS